MESLILSVLHINTFTKRHLNLYNLQKNENSQLKLIKSLNIRDLSNYIAMERIIDLFLEYSRDDIFLQFFQKK